MENKIGEWGGWAASYLPLPVVVGWSLVGVFYF